MTPTNSNELFARVLRLGSILIAGVAVLGGAIGFFAASVAGLVSALIGAASQEGLAIATAAATRAA